MHRLLREDPEIESQRIRELLAEQGYAGGKTITDDYVREVRPLFAEQRTFQHTVYRPGDVMQFDLWQPKREIEVGYGQTRKGYVVVGALGFSRRLGRAAPTTSRCEANPCSLHHTASSSASRGGRTGSANTAVPTCTATAPA